MSRAFFIRSSLTAAWASSLRFDFPSCTVTLRILPVNLFLPGR